jgi:uncharacterized protein
MLMKKIIVISVVFILHAVIAESQPHNFRIRTITAGISINDLADTASMMEAITFLKAAKEKFTTRGYEVQTLRIATQNFYKYGGTIPLSETIAHLKKLDRIARREMIMLSIGQILPPDAATNGIAEWATALIGETSNISFSVAISSAEHGIDSKSIQAAAAVTVAISKNSKGGEGNFRFTASANCPAGIPFFPAAFHEGNRSFSIGLESPNILKEVFSRSGWTTAKEDLKRTMEQKYQPLEQIAKDISATGNWTYEGIDTSPAPGLDASIGEAIETLTKQPFGGPSSLRACALITDVLKNLHIKTCGYSGLMLPVIEDKVLARRANENRFNLYQLLLFSAVSGTGLDVIPLPGNTSQETLERIYYDVAALSLKYSNKALSARLFLIPGKTAGDLVKFENPFLTSAKVMRIE